MSMFGTLLAKIAVSAAVASIEKQMGRAKKPILKDPIINEVAMAIATEPVLRNELNMERPIQSRVVVGGFVAVMGSVGAILTELSTKDFPNYDWGILGPALVTLGGGIFALYGRLRSGLKPMFSRG